MGYFRSTPSVSSRLGIGWPGRSSRQSRPGSGRPRMRRCRACVVEHALARPVSRSLQRLPMPPPDESACVDSLHAALQLLSATG